MASKGKSDAPAKDEKAEKGEKGDEGANGEAAPKKAGLVGLILGRLMALPRLLNPLAFLKLPLMMKLMVGGGALAALLVVGGAAYFLMGSASEEGEEVAEESVQTEGPHLPAEHAAFFDVPDIIVNIQSADAMPAFLKLAVSLELEGEEAKSAIEPVLPRVTDQFQSYLRELRVDDVRGSAGIMRLKEELLRRVNLAVAPTPVHDVLIKEMIVQ